MLKYTTTPWVSFQYYLQHNNLLSEYFILLIFNFNSKSISTIILLIRFFISVRLIFSMKVSNPIFD